MEIHQMRYMYAVAETGSFIAAAARERVETRLILVRARSIHCMVREPCSQQRT